MGSALAGARAKVMELASKAMANERDVQQFINFPPQKLNDFICADHADCPIDGVQPTSFGSFTAYADQVFAKFPPGDAAAVWS
jgi:hypothetical protein